MQLMGHQVVGSKNTSHEEVKAMYIKLFKGESIQIKKMLKKEFGAIEGKTWDGKPMGYYRLAVLVVLKCSRSQLTESFLEPQLLQIV